MKSTIDLMDSNGLEHLLSDVCHTPDHNLLTVDIEMSTSVKEQLCGNTLGSKEVFKAKIHRKTGECYMNSELADRMIPMMISNLENLQGEQDEMNACYHSLVNFLLEEVVDSKKVLASVDQPPNTKNIGMMSY